MKMVDRVRTAFKLLTRGFEDYDDKKYLDYFYGPSTKSGVSVNQNTVLTLSAIYCGLNVIAGIIASLPKGVYRRLNNGGREKAYDHPLYDKIHTQPNEYMSSWDWIYCQIMHKYLWGNWYTWIIRPSFSNVDLLPLLPDVTYRDPETGSYVTEIKNKNYRIESSNILHIPHVTMNGISGKGFVYYARESLGIAKALDEFAGSFFGTGVNPGGIVEAPKMDPTTRQNLQDDFNKKYKGLGSLFKVIWLTGGATYKKEELDAEKMQALESRQFSVIEAARFLNLPPHILKDLSRATYSNIEQQSTELVIMCLMPLVTQIENSMNIAFMDTEERKDHYVKFELKGLLRGDLEARTAFYTAMLDRGVLNADDVLDLEDENPQPKGIGKKYYIPLNFIDKESSTSLSLSNSKSDIKPIPAKKEMVLISEKRSFSTLRRKISVAYKTKFKELADVIIKKELKDIREAVTVFLSKKAIGDFNKWLEKYYKDISNELDILSAPLVSSYATAVLPIAQEEISSESDINVQYEVFQREYRGYLVKRHIVSSKEQLKSSIKVAQDEETGESEAIQKLLAEWEEKRSGEFVLRETVRAENAFARSVFALCGIKKIKSLNHNDDCVYCQALHGKIIGIEENFLPKGDFKPEGADSSLTVLQNCSHPPYHDGCECGIEAEV